MNSSMTRRQFSGLAAACLVARRAMAQSDSLLLREIPRSGERVPAVGLGTASIFDTLQVLGLKLGAIALYSIPVVAGWFVLSLALGRTQEKRSAELGESHSVVEA